MRIGKAKNIMSLGAGALLLLSLVSVVAGSAPPPPRGNPSVINYDDLVDVLTQNVLDAYQRGASGVNNLASTLENQTRDLSDQVKAGFDSYQSKYCTPASFVPGVKVPGNFTGPAMSLTFSTGNCTFNETRFIVDGVKELSCFEPSIIYSKTAPSFVSKHLKAAVFTSKSCSVSKSFGTPEVKTLLTFDGSQQLDTQSLSEQIANEVRALLSTLGAAGGPISFPFTGRFAGAGD